MKLKKKKILPSELFGPRSYFTDLDPNDPNYERSVVERKLKLQLLTKEKIVIAASSLFHNVGLEIVQQNHGLITALEHGIILPAIRNEFDNLNGFFERKTNFSKESSKFFEAHVASFISWDLQENTTWFKNSFFNAIKSNNSVLRKYGCISENEAQHLMDILNNKMGNDVSLFLRREDIFEASDQLEPFKQNYLINYANLIYRLSGARVVNSEGHFPQSNLTSLKLISNDKLLSDESLFWDIYIEAVTTYLNQAIYMMPDRLYRLSFNDILIIRKSLFDHDFIMIYDKLLTEVKDSVAIFDPEKLILNMQEINEMAQRLNKEFRERIQNELTKKDTSVRENALFQVANVLSMLNPVTGLVVGTFSALKAIPEITAVVSNDSADSMKNKIEWMRNFINSKIGWSVSQKRAFINAYKELVTYGLPE
ncbi:hypothetical protein DSCO28_63290 [Desulfosarcina ovata subsp. sediminis]|uniref:Uncharacterized protein n=1 Tax=Desulfosarcina ovata subsp. sediminis TaxID=885957 RepID=A0A5K7ZZT3_9BACT|nr:hypothetical protein [Desulfosarcina ovata]BBO85763.1 hypothetical protein DSCO28_63290 [Desulfosarcina ovata subsp. sediminis]